MHERGIQLEPQLLLFASGKCNRKAMNRNWIIKRQMILCIHNEDTLDICIKKFGMGRKLDKAILRPACISKEAT